MTDLLLRECEQDAVRAVIASDPLLGTALPGDSTLRHLVQLIACDSLGIALLDATGAALEESALPLDLTGDDDLPPSAGPSLGIQQIDLVPARDGPRAARAVAVLCLGVRKGTDHVVLLWMARRTGNFSGRDRAVLRLVAPALERLMRGRPTSTLPPSLTVQERSVLRQVAVGLSNAELAERLSVAPCTVRKHLENAYRKLGVTNRLAAVSALGDGPRSARAANGPNLVHIDLEFADPPAPAPCSRR
jgi:DNA-binding CsgD family transcriptional regulator